MKITIEFDQTNQGSGNVTVTPSSGPDTNQGAQPAAASGANDAGPPALSTTSGLMNHDPAAELGITPRYQDGTAAGTAPEVMGAGDQPQ